MRGKAIFEPSILFITRITPAYAGKSHFFHINIIPLEDHPRLCGEKLSGAAGVAFSSGSPPPMRGKVLLPRRAGLVIGITPAYAGKRENNTRGYTSEWDHPRLCGEKFRCHQVRHDKRGSPPPMRGKAIHGR